MRCFAMVFAILANLAFQLAVAVTAAAGPEVKTAGINEREGADSQRLSALTLRLSFGDFQHIAGIDSGCVEPVQPADLGDGDSELAGDVVEGVALSNPIGGHR